MATGSLVGRMGGGLLIDRVSVRRCLVLLPLFTALTLALPLALPGSAVPVTLSALTGCGLTYGLNAVALPVVVRRERGRTRSISGGSDESCRSKRGAAANSEKLPPPSPLRARVR